MKKTITLFALALGLHSAPAISADYLIGEGDGGTNICLTAKENPTGFVNCPYDCDRSDAFCRSLHPYVADRPAEQIFRRIAGRSNSFTASQLDAYLASRGRSAGLPYLEKMATLKSTMNPFDTNGNSRIELDECLKYAASCYNAFANDEVGKFAHKVIVYPRGGEWTDPRNPLTAAYLRFEDTRVMSYGEYRRRFPGIRIPTPNELVNSQRTGTWSH